MAKKIREIVVYTLIFYQQGDDEAVKRFYAVLNFGFFEKPVKKSYYLDTAPAVFCFKICAIINQIFIRQKDICRL